MNPKQIVVKFNINQQRFRDNYFFETEIQKYFRVFSLQITSIKDYFYEFINTYRFYAIGSTINLGTKNFPSVFPADDGAVESIKVAVDAMGPELVALCDQFENLHKQLTSRFAAITESN